MQSLPKLKKGADVVNNTILEDLKEEDISFAQGNGHLGPRWKGSGEQQEPNPMDEELPELMISNNNTLS